MKQLANKGDVKNARILAREVVRSHKQKDRLTVSKARLGSIGHQLQQQLGAMLRTFTTDFNTHAWQQSPHQGYRISTEVDRDHETLEFPH